MKTTYTIAALMLAAGTTAHAQLNRSFETGDLTGFELNQPGAGMSTVVSQTDAGQLPTHGSFMARLQAGPHDVWTAAAMLGVQPERLVDLYLDLGGDPAEAWDGDYNVMQVHLPEGNYVFDAVLETPDDGDFVYIDHGFVMNGSSQFTMLAHSLDGEPAAWKQHVVSHPGGVFSFVSANGGNTSADGVLFIDDTLMLIDDNGSFETGGFAAWTVADGGSGNASIEALTDFGTGPTHGWMLARLQSGEVSQTEAEELLGLASGRLAELYVELGGTEESAEGGDYTIISQWMAGTKVRFDVAVDANDYGNPQFLDHAFTVDSEGNIEPIVNTLEMDQGWAPWTSVEIDHPGGEFHIVCANGGDDVADLTIFVDNVVDGPGGIDATSSWNGVDSLVAWGDGPTKTAGQTFRSEETQALKSVTFHVRDLEGEAVEFEAYVYEWDGDKPTGAPVFASGVLSTDNVEEGFEALRIETPGARMKADTTYVAFLSVLNTAPTGAKGDFGLAGGDVTIGGWVTSDAGSFGDLLTDAWSAFTAWDLAFEVEFGPLDRAVVPMVNERVEGPSFNAFPWGSGGDFRYQQLYDADQFCGQSGVIESFAYRVQTLGDAFGPITVVADIWMGHTSVEPGEMSATFDENFTGDRTVVYSGGVQLSSAGQGGFDVVVDINDVFTYDPAQGNLIIEIRLPFDGQQEAPFLDSAGVGFFEGGTAWSDRLIASDAFAETGILIGNDGHVTRFSFAGADCLADCNGDGVLNILDFVCFQGKFVAGEMGADCDGNGALNILDFVCFQSAFVEGCN